MAEEIDATLFQNQPYRVPVIGWMHEMEQLNRVDAVAFYDKYYAPNNAVLVVAGDVDAATVKALAETDLRQGAARAGSAAAHPPDRAGTEHQAHGDDARCRASALPSFQKSWVVPSYRTAKDGEAEALDLLSEILGGGIRSRIYQQLVVENGHRLGRRRRLFGNSFLDDTSFSIYGAPRGEAGIEQVEERDRRRDRQDHQGRRHRQRAGKGQEPLRALDDLCARQPGRAWPTSMARR